jgi:FSR family fosmidomycin resistance protein-like MFS transporter
VKKQERSELFSYGLVMMVITHALVHSAGNIRSTLYPILKEEFTLTNQHIGLIAAIPPLMQALFSIPAGHMSDRYGAKKLIALSIGMGALGALIAGFTINPWMYIIAATLLTLNSTIYHPPAHSFAARLVERKDRAKALGFLNAGGTFGIAVGPLSITILMGWLAFTWRQLYLFWVGPIVFGFVLLYFAKIRTSVEEKPSKEEGLRNVGEAPSFRSRSFLFYLSSRGIRMFAMSMAGTFISVYLTEVKNWTVPEIGIMFGVSSLLGLVASPVGGFIASKLGEKRWAVYSFTIGYACFFLAFLVDGVIPFMVLFLTYRFCGILSMPAMASITARLSPPNQMGMGFALSFMPASISGIIAPLFAAWIADTYGLFPIFMVAIVVMYLSLLIFQLGVRIK